MRSAAGILGILAVMFWLGLGAVKTSSVQLEPTRLIEEELQNVNMVRFDKDGQMTQKINVSKWLHFQGDTIVYLSSPALWLHKDNKTWQIISATGSALQTKVGGPLESVHLEKNVTISYQTPQAQDWQLHTEELALFPDQQLATTNAWVEIQAENYQLRAKGMQAFLTQEDIHFHEEITGAFHYGS